MLYRYSPIINQLEPLEWYMYLQKWFTRLANLLDCLFRLSSSLLIISYLWQTYRGVRNSTWLLNSINCWRNNYKPDLCELCVQLLLLQLCGRWPPASLTHSLTLTGAPHIGKLCVTHLGPCVLSCAINRFVEFLKNIREHFFCMVKILVLNIINCCQGQEIFA